MLVWTDLETTGLDPSQEHILEVACIITDDNLVEVARFERVVFSPKAAAVLRELRFAGIQTAEEFRALPRRPSIEEPNTGLTQQDIGNTAGVDPYVVAMHLENGLWKASRRGENVATVDADLRDFIREHGVTTQVTREGKNVTVKPRLAGSTISFDREFMRAHFPLTTAEGKEGVLHHRNVDVSTLNEVARRFWVPVYDARPGVGGHAKHRGMDDIRQSIEVLRHYLKWVAPVVQNDAFASAVSGAV